jgi:hypothetical protein
MFLVIIICGYNETNVKANIAKFVPRSVTDQTNNENTTKNKREIFPR